MTSIPAASSLAQSALPFDRNHLDQLLEEAGLDALVATSPHNVSYLLGGYYFFMYSVADSIGLSRYLPALAYRQGVPEDALYVGAGNENWGTDVQAVWVPDVRNVAWSAANCAEQIVEWSLAHLPADARLGVELPYLPAEAYSVLLSNGFELKDATELLESLRAIKRPEELDLVRQGAEAVVDSMLATYGATQVGESKADLFERLRVEETNRGLLFCYALVSMGSDMNRAPSSQSLASGEVLSLDSGATFRGWVADLTRMAIAGEPTSRHVDLLAQVDHVQQAARALAAPGTRGGDLFDAARSAIAECDDREHLSFLAHGTGLVTHEAPRLTATGSPPYAAAHAELPLQPGMVLSIESQVADPALGFIKLEDTVIVGESGPEPVGDHGRGWNRIAD